MATPSIYVVSALAGNAWRESHINPTLGQKNGSAFGIFQWDGSRKKYMLAWLKDNDYAITDADGQLQYLIEEDEWQGSYKGISDLDEFLSSKSTDVAMLTTAFCTCWERPGKPELSERIEFANKALSYIRTHYNDIEISEWETEPMYYLSESQALNNAVLMYRYYNGDTPPKPTPSGNSKTPIWMMIRYF